MIDVSHHQHDINWKKVAGDGVKGAYIKATEGSEDGDAFVDDRMDENFKQATDNGLETGFYHYGKFVNEKDAVAEADWFIENIKDYDFTMPPTLDLEENNADSVDEMNKGTKVFLERVEDKLGVVGLYSMGDFYEDKVEKDLTDRYAYWHARYADDPKNVKLDDIFMWQYSSDGSVAGIDGNVDMDKTGGKFFTTENQSGDKKKKKKSNSKKTKKKKQKPKTYKVKNGDTLSEIAQKVGVKMKKIKDLNGIKNADAIKKGQKLQLKGKKKKTHTVKSGDTLSDIAQKYGTKMKTIKKWNDITNADAIQEGDKIRVK